MHIPTLRKIAMAGMFVLILLSFALANVHSFIWVNSAWLVSSILPAVVVAETNEARAEAALSPLVRSDVLDRAAQLKAEDMALHGYFSHKSPDGLSPWHWFTEAGYLYAYAGENLAVHFTDSRAVVDAWLNSPTHRANVMNGTYKEIGIGTAKGVYEGHDTLFVVQLFGTPAIPAPSPIVRTEAQPAPVAVALTEEIVPEVAPEPVISETDAGTVVLETYMATKTTNAVLGDAIPTAAADTETSLFARMATSPSSVLQLTYALIGLVVMSLLSYSLVFEWRHHHPRETAYSAGLLAAMVGLFLLHATVTGGVIV
jgi:hypothetical protein